MWEIRTIRPDDVNLFRNRLSRGFGGDADTDEAASRRFEAVFEYDRTLAVFDGDDIVGTGGAFSLGLTVPGGATVPMGGTTVITVQPTHRRRGILRQLMQRHLDDVANHDEPLAGLWASETTIYGRFGYGPATYRHDTRVDAPKAGLRVEEPVGRVRLIGADEAGQRLPELYEAARTGRPGMLTRADQWWEHRLLADVESRRGGKSEQRYLIHEVDGEPSGYAIYRQKSKWDDFVADGQVDVVEVVAHDPATHREIWGFLTSIDLFPRVEWWNAPVDDPLVWMVADSRRLRRSVSDALWIRVMDVPVALEARTYEADGDVTIEVNDAFRPATGGVYRLEVWNGKASCSRSGGSADLTLDSDVLGHLYLGGGSAFGMAAAGRIGGDPGAVATLHRMFSTDVAPWCPEVF